MFATLSRANNFDQLVRRFSGPSRIGDAPAEPRRRPLRSVAVRNRHRPTAAPLQRCAEAPAAAPVEGKAMAKAKATATAKAKDALQFPATGIYAAHPMLRRIANLEAKLAQAAWAEAEQADKARSVASGFRYCVCGAAPVAATGSGQADAPPEPTRLDLESTRAMEIAVQIHEARIACGQPVYPDRTWYREGLVRRALEQL
ncbi:hypothetical protein [Stenotrophomonas sp. CFBP8980]|uniref:hypothetical protein n=1 Tax=Stenotrophomonas sp. CFBP8980 TaxID=3096523 RepID=UPI002A6A28E1|nr:hypothetical protein [Stenotrophomonas sp. CFBP8980]MDY1032278.1 hypothetical protein [Stenotrophomonas sp. CFBP8980]